MPGDPKGDSKRLEGSMYRVKGAKETRPTLVYLHANSSSRVTVYAISIILVRTT